MEAKPRVFVRQPWRWRFKYENVIGPAKRRLLEYVVGFACLECPVGLLPVSQRPAAREGVMPFNPDGTLGAFTVFADGTGIGKHRELFSAKSFTIALMTTFADRPLEDQIAQWREYLRRGAVFANVFPWKTLL